MNLLQDVHYAAYMLDFNSSLSIVTEEQALVDIKGHLRKYCCSEQSGQRSASLIEETLLSAFQTGKEIWKQDLLSDERETLIFYTGSPLL